MVFSKFLAVGDKTENGKVFEAAQIDDSVRTPLNEQLDGLADLITKLDVYLCSPYHCSQADGVL